MAEQTPEPGFNLRQWTDAMQRQTEKFVADMQAQTLAAFNAACVNLPLPSPYAESAAMTDSEIVSALASDRELRAQVAAMIQSKKARRPRPQEVTP